MERDGTGQLSTVYTYGNQRINSESYNNLTGLYTYDGRGSVSAVIGTWGDFRASYWYDGLRNVKSQIHGYGAFGSGKKYYGYNAEQYNPVTGNQNLRNRQLNIRRQRFLTEDTYLGNKRDIYSLNRYLYANNNPLIYKDPDGNFVITLSVLAIAVVVATVGAGVGVGVYNGVKTGDWEYGLKTGLVAAGTVGTAVATGTAILTGGATTPIAIGAGKATVALAGSTYVGSVVHGESENLLLNKKHSQIEIFGNATKNSISTIPAIPTMVALPTKEGASIAVGLFNATSNLYDNLFTSNKHTTEEIVTDTFNSTAIAYSMFSLIETAVPVVSGLVNDIKSAWNNKVTASCAENNYVHNNVSEYFDKRPEFTGTTREKLLQAAGDYDLRNEINELYRDKAIIGDGGTADALRYEYANGISKHLQKANEHIRSLNKILKENSLDFEDMDIAESLRDDLESAINLFK